MNLLYVTNGAAVGIFGMVLSGAFCDIHWTKEIGRASCRERV